MADSATPDVWGNDWEFEIADAPFRVKATRVGARVLSGRPTLRGEKDSRELEVGDVVACPMGRRGAHRVENNSEEPARCRS